jgi:hypothetical protein
MSWVNLRDRAKGLRRGRTVFHLERYEADQEMPFGKIGFSLQHLPARFGCLGKLAGTQAFEPIVQRFLHPSVNWLPAAFAHG